MTKQPYAALVCRLMVSTNPHPLNPCTYMDCYSFLTSKEPTRSAEFIWLVDTLPTKWPHVNYKSGKDRGKSASQRTTF